MDSDVYKNRLGEEIRVGDKVYNNHRGESGIPLRVLRFRELDWHNGVIPQAYCEGTDGWGFKPEWYAISNLVRAPDMWGYWPSEGDSND